MENLKTQGYKLVPKRIGLDMTHIKLLLDKVGSFYDTVFVKMSFTLKILPVALKRAFL